MLTLRGFSACIETNGAPLPEYLVSVDEKASKVSCWIPGIEGQTFKVHWSDEGSKITTCAFIVLDGVVVPGRFLHGEGAATRGGVRVSTTTERPFAFKKVKDMDPTAQEESNEAGLIALKIKRVKCVTPQAPNPIQTKPARGALGMRKPGDLRIGFGEEMAVEAQLGATWSVEAYESDIPGAQPRTFVSFVFRYRSPEFLDTQGIAPMEQTQPWAAHTRRLATRRTVSLPVHLLRDHQDENSMPSAANSATSMPYSGFFTMGPPSASMSRTTSISNASQASTPGSSHSSELHGSPEQFTNTVSLFMPVMTPPANAMASHPATISIPEATEQEVANHSQGALGKGRPIGWRPWVNPDVKANDPRRAVSWKLPKDNASSSSGRSVRGVDRTLSGGEHASGSPQVYQSAFMVSIPRQNPPGPPTALQKELQAQFQHSSTTRSRS